MATKQTKTQVEKESTEVVSKSEVFFNQYKKRILGTLAVIVVVVLAVLGYNQFIAGPAHRDAQADMYHAENAFMQGNFDLALNGDGNVLGFDQVIENYGSNADKSVYFYAGVCALQLEKYEDAINYLNKYNGKDPILKARAIACIGDAYVALENYSSAVEYFNKAVAVSDNIFNATYLLKAGLTYEAMGDKVSALKCYNDIKDKYQGSIESYDIDRYIAAVEE